MGCTQAQLRPDALNINRRQSTRAVTVRVERVRCSQEVPILQSAALCHFQAKVCPLFLPIQVNRSGISVFFFYLYKGRFCL